MRAQTTASTSFTSLWRRQPSPSQNSMEAQTKFHKQYSYFSLTCSIFSAKFSVSLQDMNIRATHVPQLTMMLPTLSVKPWEKRLGTSSSTISILRPLNSPTSNRQILCFSGSLTIAQKETQGRPAFLALVDSDRWWAGLYHANGPEGQQVVILLAIAPGVPARILALLQDEHVTAEVHLLKTNEAEKEEKSNKGLSKLL